MQVMPFVDVLFGNETVSQTFTLRSLDKRVYAVLCVHQYLLFFFFVPQEAAAFAKEQDFDVSGLIVVVCFFE